MLNECATSLMSSGDGLQECIALMHHIGTLSGLQVYMHVLQLLGLLASQVEYRRLASDNYAPNPDKQSTIWMQNIMETICAYLPDGVRLSQFTEEMGISASKVSRFFRRNTGMNFPAYLRKLRIGRACAHLSDTPLKIVTAGAESGFQNLSNFHHEFKKEIGLMPRQYRDLSRDKQSA